MKEQSWDDQKSCKNFLFWESKTNYWLGLLLLPFRIEIKLAENHKNDQKLFYIRKCRKALDSIHQRNVTWNVFNVWLQHTLSSIKCDNFWKINKIINVYKLLELECPIFKFLSQVEYARSCHGINKNPFMFS